jgi:hypothetical protein
MIIFLVHNPESNLFIQSHVRTLANHLLSCEMQSSNVKTRVADYKKSLNNNLRSPAKATQSATIHYGTLNPAVPIPRPLFHNLPPNSILLNSPPNQLSDLPTDETIDPQLRFHPYLRPASMRSPDNPSPPSSAYLAADSSADSVSPFDSISQPPSRPSSQMGRTLLRRRSYNPGTHLQPDMFSAQHWSPTRKKAFEKRIMRLTASAGFPLSWTENLEWRLFCDEFVPGAPPISRKVLTKRILNEVVEEFRLEVKKEVAKQEATMQSDGWTGVNNHHLVAFMITASKKVCGARIFPIIIKFRNMEGTYHRSP